MIKNINHIAFNDLFWFQIKPHLISFGFKGLPADTHFTIGFDPRSPDINLHLTKNVKDYKNKPKVTVVKINKTILEEDLEILLIKLLNKLMQPFDFQRYRSQFDYNLGFISLDNFQTLDGLPQTKQGLIDLFKELHQIKKKTRLKIKGDVDGKLESYAKSESFREEMIGKLIEIDRNFTTLDNGGIIISEEKTILVLRFDKAWYSIKNDMKLIDLITIFVNQALATKIIQKAKRAIIIVKQSQSYEESAKHDQPIKLVRKRT